MTLDELFLKLTGMNDVDEESVRVIKLMVTHAATKGTSLVETVSVQALCLEEQLALRPVLYDSLIKGLVIHAMVLGFLLGEQHIEENRL